MVSPNNVPHRLSHCSAADLGASKKRGVGIHKGGTRVRFTPGWSRVPIVICLRLCPLESEQKSSRSETIREPVIGIPVWVMISACGRAERRKYVGNCDAVTAGGAIRG
jgi:hypothetical protein